MGHEDHPLSLGRKETGAESGAVVLGRERVVGGQAEGKQVKGSCRPGSVRCEWE